LGITGDFTGTSVGNRDLSSLTVGIGDGTSACVGVSISTADGVIAGAVGKETVVCNAGSTLGAGGCEAVGGGGDADFALLALHSNTGVCGGRLGWLDGIRWGLADCDGVARGLDTDGGLDDADLALSTHNTVTQVRLGISAVCVDDLARGGWGARVLHACHRGGSALGSNGALDAYTCRFDVGNRGLVSEELVRWSREGLGRFHWEEDGRVDGGVDGLAGCGLSEGWGAGLHALGAIRALEGVAWVHRGDLEVDRLGFNSIDSDRDATSEGSTLHESVSALGNVNAAASSLGASSGVAWIGTLDFSGGAGTITNLLEVSIGGTGCVLESTVAAVCLTI
jgi:hypothetical protein